jgi:hypothetical protein
VGCAVTIVRRYAEHLRVIGQAIEARDFAVYEIVHLSEWYVIHGIPDETGSVRSKVRHWLRRLRQEAPPQSFTLDLTEIEKLSEAGRARRSTPGRLTDLASVSNSLRTIGAYLDAREVELFQLKKKGKVSVTLWYRDKAGHDRKEERTISSFSQLCVKLCERRGKTQKSSKG